MRKSRWRGGKCREREKEKQKRAPAAAKFKARRGAARHGESHRDFMNEHFWRTSRLKR